MPLKLYPGQTADDVALFTGKNKVQSAVVVNGGSGYAVNDILKVLGGEFYPAALLKVSTVAVDVVTAVTIESAGQYLKDPVDPVTTRALTGSGSGATFNLTMLADVIAQASIVSIKHRGSIWYLKYWE